MDRSNGNAPGGEDLEELCNWESEEGGEQGEVRRWRQWRGWAIRRRRWGRDLSHRHHFDHSKQSKIDDSKGPRYFSFFAFSTRFRSDYAEIFWFRSLLPAASSTSVENARNLRLLPTPAEISLSLSLSAATHFWRDRHEDLTGLWNVKVL